MRTLLLVLLLAVSAQAQSVVYRIGPIPAKAIHVDTLTAGAALSQIVSSDSGFIVRQVDNGDVNGDGRVATSDIIYLKNFVLQKGPAPKGRLISQLVLSSTRDSAWIMYILVDSVGVKAP